MFNKEERQMKTKLYLSAANELSDEEGRTCRFTVKEATMVRSLCRYGSTRVTTKEAFLLDLYARQDEPELKIIDVFVCKIRKKVRDAGMPSVFETIWGRGYRLDPNVEVVLPEGPGVRIVLPDGVLKRLEDLAFARDCTIDDVVKALVVDNLRDAEQKVWEREEVALLEAS
jgi:DNA-binding winged helix-turn-helix (wHTH) protein